MHRTGIPLGDSCDLLRSKIESLAGLEYAGLHVYDGHLHSSSLDQRRTDAMEVIKAIRSDHQAHPSPAIVGGGSPTYAIWADSTDWECSPGTSVFWDRGYATKFSELPFSIAIALLTRVISKPGDDCVCFDLGYKAIASEKDLAGRLAIPAIEDGLLVDQHEEHLVVKTKHASAISLGQPFLAFPRHVCPTVALYEHANVIRGGQVTSETWQVTARDRATT